MPFLLQGLAREVFDGLPLENRVDYDKLKEALLKHFELTDECTRNFGQNDVKDSETSVMFTAGLGSI